MDYKTYILCALRKCVRESLKKPRAGLKKDYFAYLTYQKWAAEEVINYIENYDGDPQQAIEVFMKKADHCACINSKMGFIFSIAYDVAVWLLDEFFAIEGEINNEQDTYSKDI